MTVVLVPVSAEQLAALRERPMIGPLRGFAVTAALRDTYGLAVADDEEADRTALLLAGLAALMSHGRRLAVVVDKPAVDDGDPLGEVGVASVTWSDVSAIFADAPEAVDAVAAAAAAVSGLDLDAAWDTDEAQTLMVDHDLLWFGPEEADAVLKP